MTRAIIEILLHAGVLATLAALLSFDQPRPAGRSGWVPALLLALLLVVLHDALLLRGYGLLPDAFDGSRWNWTGKLLALAGLLALTLTPAFAPEHIGLRWRQAAGSAPAWWLFAALAAALFALAVALGGGAADADSIAFQWTMPGLQEELFYRGVLLCAFDRAFGVRWRVLGVELGWGGVLTTVAFGLAHALSWTADGARFDALAFLLTGPPSLLLLWLRLRSGSLLLPVLAHNVANGAFVLF